MFRLFPEKNKYRHQELDVIFDPNGVVPEHIAIIMDGNGRWAKNRRLPRVAGHKEGMNTVKKITRKASQLGVKVLTLYAFSTENWKRPDDEVNYLMQLPVDFFDTFVPELMAENVVVKVMGYTEYLPTHTQNAVERAIKDTAGNTGMILNFALNYGGRSEILTGVRQLLKDVSDGKLTEEDVDEALFSSYLMTGDLSESLRDPALLIRTSGEERISNFLLWQIAYSELFFTDAYWPDFDEELLLSAIAAFQKRDRRFGGVKNHDGQGEETK